MMKSGASVSEVNSQIDAILIKMDTVEVVVPEFGTIAAIILAVAITSIIVISTRSKLNLVPKL